MFGLNLDRMLYPILKNSKYFFSDPFSLFRYPLCSYINAISSAVNFFLNSPPKCISSISFLGRKAESEIRANVRKKRRKTDNKRKREGGKKSSKRYAERKNIRNQVV